jgi:predicted HTH transcriptional regulator
MRDLPTRDLLVVLPARHLPWRKTRVLVVQVHPSATRPHYLARHGPEAGAFVRVGSTTRLADVAQIEEMRRFGQVGAYFR